MKLASLPISGLAVQDRQDPLVILFSGLSLAQEGGMIIRSHCPLAILFLDQTGRLLPTAVLIRAY